MAAENNRMERTMGSAVLTHKGAVNFWIDDFKVIIAAFCALIRDSTKNGVTFSMRTETGQHAKWKMISANFQPGGMTMPLADL